MDFRRVRTFAISGAIGICLGLILLAAISQIAGCLAMDEAVTDVNTVATTAKTIIDSPAGRLVPPDYRLYGSAAAAAIAAAAAAYKQWRLPQVTKTTKAIVRGIEKVATRRPQATENPGTVKKAIAMEMRRLKIYDTGNAIVDRLKLQ